MKSLSKFQGLGITSFDSTGPMLRSFKDDKSNYYKESEKHYPAIRVPSPDEAKTKNSIKSGKISGTLFSKMESNALQAIRECAEGKITTSQAVNTIHSLDNLIRPGSDNRKKYTRLLDDRPWESCPCKICRSIGVEVVIHRNLNRHKRRGFHNLWTFYEHLKKIRKQTTLRVPCLRTEQSEGKRIYSFSINGKEIPKFASVSRIARNQNGELEGYQRPEIATHIDEIQQYLERNDSILPNALIIAFNDELRFDKVSDENKDTQFGHLNIPISKTKKIGWVVDGQQRLAAIRRMNRQELSVPVTAIESQSIDDEREQFVLINNTRPLPKSLVYELLPSIGDATPPRLQRRRRSYEVLQILVNNGKSPFYRKIKTTTTSDLKTAIIKDVSVLRMIENSAENGTLSKYGNSYKKQAAVLIQYWDAVVQTYRSAWDLPPKSSRLTHGAGIVSMGYLMDAIAFRLQHREKPLATHSFKNELEKIGKLPWTEGSWEFAPDFVLPWNGIQNTNKDIDLLTNHLIRLYQSNCNPMRSTEKTSKV